MQETARYVLSTLHLIRDRTANVGRPRFGGNRYGKETHRKSAKADPETTE